MAKIKQKKTIKRQSVKEFKAWLEGITEFQPADWCPSAEQWNTIKDKISNLQDEIIIKEVQNVQAPTPSNTSRKVVSTLMNPSQEYVQPTDQNAQPLKIVRGGISLLPTEDDGASELIEYPVEIDNTGQPIIQTVSSQVLATGTRIKTPHIDTSGGKPYKSSFA